VETVMSALCAKAGIAPILATKIANKDNTFRLLIVNIGTICTI